MTLIQRSILPTTPKELSLQSVMANPIFERMNANFQHSHHCLLEKRTHNADRTQKINSDCAEKSRGKPFHLMAKEAENLRLMRYKSLVCNNDESCWEMKKMEKLQMNGGKFEAWTL